MKNNIVYNPYLSVKDNAINNNVSIGTIRKYILENKIDRNYDKRILTFSEIQKIKQENPSISILGIRNKLGYSINTIKKYLTISKNDLSIKSGKQSRFDLSKSSNLIKSVSDNQYEVLKSIISLYIKKGYFDCDLTFSKGLFYKYLPLPSMKFDKYPCYSYVEPLEKAYNITSSSLHSIIIDLPFIVRNENISTSMIDKRFNSFSTINELYKTNSDMLNLSYNKLRYKGVLVMKTMDINFNGKQYWIGNFVQNEALKIGFELIDTFILISKSKILSNNVGTQHCARKWHSYFFVFRKNKG